MKPQGHPGNHLVAQSELPGLRARYRDAAIVLATGCFDLIHRGHACFLNEAAGQGDILVVGLNNDASVRRLKGPSRPMVRGMDRAALVAEFRCVDHVFLYDELCAAESIRALRPDVFAVGAGSVGCYPEEINAAREARARIHEIRRKDAPSTSSIISSIRNRDRDTVVSIVYVNWNTRDLLRDSLESLVRHSGGQAYEIIVIDNGSSDGSVPWLRTEWPQVRVVPLDENLGFGRGHNAGFQVASSEYILILNTDTIVLESTVAGLRRVLDENATVGCVGARHLNRDGSLQRSMDSFPNLEADFLTFTELHRLRPFRRYLAARHAWWSDHERSRQVDWVNGACLMIRREVLDDVGGFDPNFFIYGEELDWCYRMLRKGWKVVYAPDSEIIHLGGRSMDGVPVERLCLKYEGILRFYDKHRSLVSRCIIRLIVVGTVIGRGVALVVGSLVLRPTSGYDAFYEFVTQLQPASGVSGAFRAWRRICYASLRSHR